MKERFIEMLDLAWRVPWASIKYFSINAIIIISGLLCLALSLTIVVPMIFYVITGRRWFDIIIYLMNKQEEFEKLKL